MAIEVSRLSACDAAETVARVAVAKREVLLRVYRRRLRWEDLEDCYSQATLELVARARRGATFDSPQHVANSLEQKFVSRINDRHRAVGGRSAAEMAIARAVSVEDANSGVAELVDHRVEVAEDVVRRQELSRLREVAADLTDDQRLVLACQVTLGLEAGEFCRRFGWSAEKFRKVAQRARARLRVLTVDYQSGERCRQLEPTLLAFASGAANPAQLQRARLHLENCRGCAQMVRGLEQSTRKVAALLGPVGLAPTGLLAKVVLATSVLGRRALRLLPGPHAAPVAASAAGGGGAAIGAGGSLVSLGAAKLGVAALCVAGVAGGYAVCARTGLLPGAVGFPRAAHRVARIHHPRASAPALPSTLLLDRRLRMPMPAQMPAVGGPSRGFHRSATPRMRTRRAGWTLSQTRREFGGAPAPARVHLAEFRAVAPLAPIARRSGFDGGGRARSQGPPASAVRRTARREFGSG